ncbi:hypothetical protein H0H81_012256 [Sphagnurus paluster]|uniref:NADAR domain-containing protein n=1 Tax=Sphagnurus paluster TaxID=117069 RepID=A0A9P7GMV8_9AGAR|nr:hypothetical protein H0H81_012256 [Sphagnurus paluster]
MRRPKDYVFFWKTDANKYAGSRKWGFLLVLIAECSGWASQWYASPFTVMVGVAGEEREATFTSAEQWMMVQKALLFSDMKIAEETLAIRETGSRAMSKIKALGRQVDGFDNDTWNMERERIVLEGNLHKFRQNEGLKQKLLATGNREFVEASPGDRIWGIGFGEERAISEKESWGLNLLGKVLGETRRILRQEVQNDVPA